MGDTHVPRNPAVTRAAENSCTNRIIGVICPLLPPRVFAKFLPIRKMVGRGGGDRNCIPHFQVLLAEGVTDRSSSQLLELLETAEPHRCEEPKRTEYGSVGRFCAFLLLSGAIEKKRLIFWSLLTRFLGGCYHRAAP
jgi:hypothetical protein